MKVDEKLKRKRSELIGEAEALAARIAAIGGQVSAIDRVIAIYDPAYAPAPASAGKARRAKEKRRIPPELDGINQSEAILEVLREAGRPLSTADCANRIAERHGVAANDAPLSSFTSNVSASRYSLMARGRVRQAGTVDGRRHLWEIAV